MFQSNLNTYPGGDLELEGGVIWFAVSGTVTLSCTVRGSCAALFGGETWIRADGTLDLSGVSFEVTDPENLPLYKDAPKVTLFTAASITGTPTLAADYQSFRLYATGNAVRFGNHRGTALLFR